MWDQLVPTIYGKDPADVLGQSLAMSSNGDVFIAGSSSAPKRAYQLYDSTKPIEWEQIGQDIGFLGKVRAMSADGNVVLFSDPSTADVGASSGAARLYRVDISVQPKIWNQLGEYIVESKFRKDLDGTVTCLMTEKAS